MSEAITIARPYAKAAFEFAKQQGELESWLVQLEQLGLAGNDAQMHDLLHDPKVLDQQVADMLKDIFKSQLSEDCQRFLDVLAEKNRLAVLPQIAIIYGELLSEYQRRVLAQVTSAFELDESQVDRMRAALAKRLDCEVTIETTIDASLLGGALIRAGDLVIDGTLRSRLDRLQDNLIEG